MFDQNPPCTFDKIWENPFQSKTFSQLDFESKVQGHSKKQKSMPWGTKNMPPKKKLAGVSLVVGVTPTLTRTSVKQYVNLYPTRGRHNKKFKCIVAVAGAS